MGSEQWKLGKGRKRLLMFKERSKKEKKYEQFYEKIAKEEDKRQDKKVQEG